MDTVITVRKNKKGTYEATLSFPGLTGYVPCKDFAIQVERHINFADSRDDYRQMMIEVWKQAKEQGIDDIVGMGDPGPLTPTAKAVTSYGG